ncbi:MAG: hypothetical protein ROO70_12790 [Labrenzia sp.]
MRTKILIRPTSRKLAKTNQSLNLAIQPQSTSFPEFRAQRPVASDVAAVDEPGYTQVDRARQQPISKKIKKAEKSFKRRRFIRDYN